ncbi:unnamed protein product [Arctogadus glacialis]
MQCNYSDGSPSLLPPTPTTSLISPANGIIRVWRHVIPPIPPWRRSFYPSGRPLLVLSTDRPNRAPADWLVQEVHSLDMMPAGQSGTTDKGGRTAGSWGWGMSGRRRGVNPSAVLLPSEVSSVRKHLELRPCCSRTSESLSECCHVTMI